MDILISEREQHVLRGNMGGKRRRTKTKIYALSKNSEHNEREHT